MPGYSHQGLTEKMQRAIERTPADEVDYAQPLCPSCQEPLQFPTDGNGHVFEQCPNSRCDNRFTKPFDRMPSS